MNVEIYEGEREVVIKDLTDAVPARGTFGQGR